MPTVPLESFFHPVLTGVLRRAEEFELHLLNSLVPLQSLRFRWNDLLTCAIPNGGFL